MAEYSDYLDRLTKELLELAETGTHIELRMVNGASYQGRLMKTKGILFIEYKGIESHEKGGECLKGSVEEKYYQEVINPLHIATYRKLF